MMNLAAILKIIGVKVPPEALGQIEALIPQIPGKANEIINYIVGAVQNFDNRLGVLEAQNRALMEMITTLAAEEIEKRVEAGVREVNYGRSNNGDSDYPGGGPPAFDGRDRG